MSVAALDDKLGGSAVYDSLSRMVQRNGNGASSRQQRYAFDAAGQLTQACYLVPTGCQGDYSIVPSVSTPSYSYDAAGNRMDPAASATVAPGNRVTSFKGYTLTYDADGNVLTKAGNGKSWSYTWDALDRLTAVYQSGVLQMQYAYDAFDRRIFQGSNVPCSSERHVWDGDQFAFATDCYGNLKDEYGWYPGSEQPLGVHYNGSRKGVILTDPKLGASVLGVADTNGMAASPLIKAYNTTAWGESPVDTGLVFRLRMAGQQYDQATGLYYMRARFYDPGLGKFMSEDPIGISGGLNLYAYAGNDPVNAADPSGMLTCVPHAYRVPVTTQYIGGVVVRADTAWDEAVGIGLDCSGDGDGGGSSVPGTEGPGKGGGGSFAGFSGRPPTKLQKIVSCAADGQSALGIASRALIAAGSIPLSKQALGLPARALGAKSDMTNVFSASRRLFGDVNLPFKLFGTNSPFGIVGHASPYVLAGLIVYDVAGTVDCYNAAGPTGGGFAGGGAGGRY